MAAPVREPLGYYLCADMMRQLLNDAAWQTVDPWPLTAMAATAEMIIEDFPTGARPAVLHGRLLNVSRMATIGEMAAGVAHELNQPLTAIANYAHACERLLSRPPSDIEDVREALRQITVQTTRAADILARLRA